MQKSKMLICVISLVLLTACGPRRLSSPPDEFTEFVDSAPVGSDATLLGEWSDVYQEETAICTGFSNARYYGVNASFSDVLDQYEAALTEDDVLYIKIEPDGHHALIYLLDEFALMSLYAVDINDLLAESRFGKAELISAHGTYDTIYVISAEHRYGDCEVHPWWPD